jgi:hypothetical protein
MRKPYPGLGAIKLTVQVIHKTKTGKNSAAHWEMIMSVQQARDFVFKGTGKLPGQNTFYALRGPKLYHIPVRYKFNILPNALDFHGNNFYILITPNAKTNTNSEGIGPECSDAKPIPGRDSTTMGTEGRKNMGTPSRSGDSPEGGGSIEH